MPSSAIPTLVTAELGQLNRNLETAMPDDQLTAPAGGVLAAPLGATRSQTPQPSSRFLSSGFARTSRIVCCFGPGAFVARSVP